MISNVVRVKHGMESEKGAPTMERLIDFYNTNRLVIGAFLFEYKLIQKLTWIARVGMIKNEMYMFIKNGKIL